MLDKLKAYSFLVDLGERLNNQLFGPEIMRAEVCRRWDKPKADKTPQEQVACPGNIFSLSLRAA